MAHISVPLGVSFYANAALTGRFSVLPPVPAKLSAAAPGTCALAWPVCALAWPVCTPVLRCAHRQRPACVALGTSRRVGQQLQLECPAGYAGPGLAEGPELAMFAHAARICRGYVKATAHIGHHTLPPGCALQGGLPCGIFCDESALAMFLREKLPGTWKPGRWRLDTQPLAWRGGPTSTRLSHEPRVRARLASLE